MNQLQGRPVLLHTKPLGHDYEGGRTEKNPLDPGVTLLLRVELWSCLISFCDVESCGFIDPIFFLVCWLVC